MKNLDSLSPSKLAGLRLLVLGAGESGVAIAQWAQSYRANVVVADSRESPPHCDALISLAITFKHSAWSESTQDQDWQWLNGFEVVAVSPGIAPHNPILQEIIRRQLPLVGEMAFFMSAIQALSPHAYVLGVTGSNGKTTTTTLIGSLLTTLTASAGKRVAIAGNIRPSALQRLQEAVIHQQFPDYWVLELSSFQLARWDRGELIAGALLNISDNHQDWHPSWQNYVDCKISLLKASKQNIINLDDPLVMAQADSSKPIQGFTMYPKKIFPHPIKRVWCEQEGALGFIDGSSKTWKALIDRSISPLLGTHNTQNILAAFAMVAAIIPPETWNIDSIKIVLQTFQGLPHRMALIKTSRGVRWINDSKSTTIASTVAALKGLNASVILLAGGMGKNQDFQALREALSQHAKHTFLYGKDAGLMAKAFYDLPHTQVDNLLHAMQQAQAMAVNNDCILLSPACASFDQFRHYEDRGEQFSVWVDTLTKESKD